MPYDQIVFSPRAGAVGDLVYGIPGATLIDGSIDAGAPTRIDAGSAAGFSATPTLPELTASSHLNQVIGLYNHRVLKMNSLYGMALATQAYLASDAQFTAAVCITFQGKINTLRAAEGFTTYVFPNDFGSVWNVRRGKTLSHLRKALAIPDSYYVPVSGSIYIRRDTPYLTPFSEQFLSTSPPSNQAEFITAGKWVAAQLNRFRTLIAVAARDYGRAIASVQMEVRLFTHSGGEAYNLTVYRSNSADIPVSITPAYAGDAYNTNNVEGTLDETNVSTTQTLNLNLAAYQAMLDSWPSYIFGSNVEVAGAGAEVTSYNETGEMRVLLTFA